MARCRTVAVEERSVVDMGVPVATGLALRIERGQADEEELAAVAVALCSVLARRRAAAGGPPQAAAPAWREPQLPGSVYRCPHSWR